MRVDSLRGWDRVLGINARNAHIGASNPPSAIRLVNDKHATKLRLEQVGAPTSETIALVRDVRTLRRMDLGAELGDAWALKPNQGLGGNGILIAADRVDGEWRRHSGRAISEREVRHQVRMIIDGEFSGRGRDAALVEPLIVAHPDMARLAHQGLPDVRVICTDDVPRLAMARLPTAASGGRANLHQRAIGAAVDLATGEITQALVGGRPVTTHPDTGTELVGAAIPFWDEIRDAAARCSSATGLRYLGVDVVVDVERGPLILEVNARPGLQIQNVTGHGLWETLLTEEGR